LLSIAVVFGAILVASEIVVIYYVASNWDTLLSIFNQVVTYMPRLAAIVTKLEGFLGT